MSNELLNIEGNKMDNYIIRKAEKKDIPHIMSFIGKYWREGHILAISEDFFEFQHVWKEEVCYIISEKADTGELEGILGYIVYSDVQPRDLFGAIWKVRSNQYPMLGMKMQMFALKNLGARTFSAVALNPNTLSMHSHWGAYLGQLKHYYLLGNFNEYKIALIKAPNFQSYNFTITQYTLSKIIDVDLLKKLCQEAFIRNTIPFKSWEYFYHRYFEHPIYTYVAYGIMDSTLIKAAFITREIQENNRKVLRIIDYLGDTKWIQHCGRSFKKLAADGPYEYIDFYEYGVNDNYLKDAGFILRAKSDPNIIPNYFEPFVQKNIDIDFYTSEKSGNILLFKGDGDQDRPNFLK